MVSAVFPMSVGAVLGTRAPTVTSAPPTRAVLTDSAIGHSSAFARPDSQESFVTRLSPETLLAQEVS